MKKIFKKEFIFILLICIGIFLAWHKNSNSQTLDEVILKNSEINKKQFAMYIRNSKDEEYQEYTNSNIFPEGYKLDLSKSGCSDSDGNKINDEEIIGVSSDNKVIIKSNKTVYCYLYFDKSGFNGTGSDLAQSKSKGLIATPDKGDLAYRYVGTKDDVDNYICFGTTNKADCTPKDSNYLYRIIGITENGNLKIIKNSSIGDIEWHSNNSENAVWDSGNEKIESELHQKLNGSTFLTSPTYIPSGWTDKIENTTWKIGDSNGYGSGKTENGNQVWAWESALSVSTASKIGLMDVSDYYYSLDGSGNKNCFNNFDDFAVCKSSWLHLSNNGVSEQASSFEWTVKRNGLDGSIYGAWNVNPRGSVSSSGLQLPYAVRPVFYLTADSQIKGGSGTSDDPYILESPEEIGEKIVQEKFKGKKPSGFSTIPTGGLYRFTGTQDEDKANKINNYVCFGKNKCTDGTDENMYRIIGITAEGNLKIQKNKALKDLSYWHSNRYTDTTWSESDIYTKILSNFFGNSEFVTEDMIDKIKSNTWSTGDVNEDTGYTSGIYVSNAEQSISSHKGYYGLAYLSDYYFAYNEAGTQNCRSNLKCASWMIPTDYNTYWSDMSSEWTMTRYRYGGFTSESWCVDYTGGVSNAFPDNTYAVRPVFYLKSNITITGGEGTLESPFIINLE